MNHVTNQPEPGMILEDTVMEEDRARSEATFCFQLRQLSLLDGFVLSPACYIRNLPWKIIVMRRIRCIQNRYSLTTLGFFLQCNGEYTPIPWSCYAVAELRLLSVKSGGEAFTKKIQHLFFSRESDWGYPEFMLWSDVLDVEQGYIQNDAVTFEVHVVADAPRGILWDSKRHADQHAQVEELQFHLAKRGERLEHTEKTLRKLRTRFAILENDFKKEKVARSKAKKIERNLTKELEAHKNILFECLDTTAAQQELISKREQELATLKTDMHEVSIAHITLQHSQELALIKEQLESIKKTKMGLDKTMQSLEAENATLVIQLAETKKKAEEEAEQAATLEEMKEKMSKDIEALQRQITELMVANDELIKSKKKIAPEEKGVSEQRAAERDAAEPETREKETKVLSLRRELDESNEKIEETKSEQRQGERGELVNNQDTADKNGHELEKAKRSLESQLGELCVQTEELENDKFWLEVNMQALRGQFERDQQAKEEQSEENLRGILKQLRDLKAELDEDRQQQTTAVVAKAKLKGDLKEVEGQLELKCKVKEDALKQQCKETCRDAKRKVKSLEADVMQLSEDLSSYKRARRTVEAEMDELQEEINGNSNKGNLLVDKKRQLEVRIATIAEELEEEQKNNEMFAVIAQNAQLTIEQQTIELGNERTTNEKHDLLLITKLTELKTSRRSKTKAIFATLEAKIANLEENLEMKTKECIAQQKHNCKLDKKLKVLVMQLEEERCHVNQYKEQVEKVNVRVNGLKRQLNEVEEEISKEIVLKKKPQRECEDMMESHESMNCEITNLKTSQGIILKE